MFSKRLTHRTDAGVHWPLREISVCPTAAPTPRRGPSPASSWPEVRIDRVPSLWKHRFTVRGVHLHISGSSADTGRLR